LKKEIKQFISWLLDTHSFDRTKPERNLLQKSNDFIDRPIFVCGGMKSGTTLLTQLLDDHPNLFVLPGGSRYFNKFYNRDTDVESAALFWIEKMINPTGQKPFWWLGKNEMSYRQFLASLHYLSEYDQGDTFLKAVRSIYAASYLKERNIRHWVEKTTGNEKNVREMMRAFPGAKSIHIVRDPLSNLTSLKRWSLITGRRFSCLFWTLYLKDLLRTGIENHRRYDPHRYHVLRYEDLVSNLREEMTKVSRFLDISYEEGLSMPTVGGEQAVSNSMYEDSRVTGHVTDTGKRARWKSELTEKEKKLVVSALYREALTFQYTGWQQNDVRRYKKDYYEPIFLCLLVVYRLRSILKRVVR
jgi:hypothetical protein